MSGYTFDPDWCVEPGATLRDVLAERDCPTVEDLVVRADLSQLPDQMRDLGVDVFVGLLQRVLRAQPLDRPEAIALHHIVGSPVEFWLSLEANFRDGLARGCVWTPRFDRATRPWLPGFGPRCSWVNVKRAAATLECGRPVIMYWRSWAMRAEGAWYRLCAMHAEREGLQL